MKEYKINVKRTEDYSGEHRSWEETYTLPRKLVERIQEDALLDSIQEKLCLEIERQCSIGAGIFSIDNGWAQSGLWQVNADLDPTALAKALQ